MRIRHILIVSSLSALFGAVVLAWLGRPETRPTDPDGRLVFRPVHEPSSQIEPWIYRGRPVNAARDYPASFYSEFQTYCSATLIGRDTILTSAHCIRRRTAVKVVTGATSINSTCQSHPRYNAGTHEHDVGLCKLHGSPWTSGFERIVQRGFTFEPSSRILVTGWGDSDPAGSLGLWWARVRARAGRSEVFRVGYANGGPRGAVILAEGELVEGEQVRLESGDSGGAAYVAGPTGRVIVGTNACTGGACGYGSKTGIVLSNLAAEDTAGFVQEWAKANGAHVCGLRTGHSDEGCRTR